MPVSANLYFSYHRDIGAEIPPMVLIHGAGGMHLYWPSEIRRLRGCCIYTIDLPGHGRSDGKKGHIKNFSVYHEMMDIMMTECSKTFPDLKVLVSSRSR